MDVPGERELRSQLCEFQSWAGAMNRTGRTSSGWLVMYEIEEIRDLDGLDQILGGTKYTSDSYGEILIHTYRCFRCSETAYSTASSPYLFEYA